MPATHAVRMSHPPREAPVTGPLAARRAARLVAFVPLALFGALQWGTLLEPEARGATALGVVAAACAGGLLVAAADVTDRRLRAASVAVCGLVLLVVSLLLAGIPLSMLGPKRWDELISGMAQGTSALPAVTVPYRGADEWVRRAMVSGGVALTAAAGMLAFWPARRGRTPGFPLAAAVALGTLYTVPIVQHGPQRPFLAGAVLCVLLATFLWLERLRADQIGVGAVCVVGATVAGAVVAPRLDTGTPWVDYVQIAEDLQPQKAATFAWNHTYGPMTWPRDGRLLLRVRAREPSYWKTTNLDSFDGRGWVNSGGARRVVDTETVRRGDWFDTVRVVDRGLRSRQFVAPGHTIAILPDGPKAISIEPGTFQTVGRPLVPGTSYRARVYVPRPTDRQLRTAGVAYPEFARDHLDMRLPRTRSQPDPTAVRFAPFGSGGVDSLFSNGFRPGGGDELVRGSPYARMYRLALSLKARADTPFAYVQAVRRRVKAGATYSESPPPSSVPLVDFMFRSRVGYCQQFSGAMALLLRMGGVPARVSAGFSPGRFDRKRGDYVVRDDDAHSWVEAYFPGIGWVTFDPTPAASPARSQLDDARSARAAAGGPEFPRPGVQGDRPFAPGDPGARAAGSSGVDWRLVAGPVVLLLAAAAAALALVRAGRLPVAVSPDLRELARALHRMGRLPPAGTTLTALEGQFRDPGGAGYVRAVRDRRFGGRGPGPTAANRRALRRDLARGGGMRRRLRAWWALPPRFPTRRTDPYTG